jgi:hypothetical protein
MRKVRAYTVITSELKQCNMGTYFRKSYSDHQH